MEMKIDKTESEKLEKIENVLKGWNESNSHKCMCEIYEIMTEAEENDD